MRYDGWRYGGIAITKVNKQPVKNKAMKLLQIAIIGKFDDGKCRQVVICADTQNKVLNAVLDNEGQITVMDKVIESINFK